MISIENFDPKSDKIIDSPRTLQAAQNLGVDIQDLYTGR